MNEEKQGMEPEGMETEFVVTRDFDAPRDLVWKMWTEPEMVKQWWGPTGFTAPVIKSDFRQGGSYLYDMRDPEGKDYWNGGEFLEIVPMERIVATDYFTDEQGNKVPPSYYGLPDDMPEERVVTETFEELEGGRTRFTVTHPASGSQDEDERAGWNQMLDKFEERLRMARAA